ncbi:dual specificity protein phosphatase 23 [Geobacter sp. OR-1]|uniref:cyclin-dependent kinase inhibitor 3 family protein n=1 Tax=Geobacter sp. OR-1 TaxID=1266765 RepID=UPI0005423E59|nr:cyclin-dependent kinase inhibitor 3 family protein [Geobacter sp. OR-1]GAM10331.1 dual specificity protein phosphatase 23 [Geobacter sp. OR-1]
MKARTSITDPLIINGVSAPGTNGVIGMTFCPGKKDEGISGLWNRDLTTDLQAIKTWGATTLVTLVEDKELHQLGVSELPVLAIELGLHWLHLPIKDADVPDGVFAKLWLDASPLLHRLLDQGEKIIVHCKGGLGRAGTVAALLLVERGMDPHMALQMVRTSRPGTVETFQQERFILNLW